MATIGFSKVFILDKYFTELQKFWETEKKLQGMHNMQGNPELKTKASFVITHHTVQIKVHTYKRPYNLQITFVYPPASV